MAWICLPESEDLALHFESGLGLSPIVRLTNMHKLSFYQGKHPFSYQSPLYGMILLLLQKKTSKVLWTSFTEVSLARTSALQEMEKVWEESAAVFSLKLSDSSKKQSRLGCFSKTSQPLELEDLKRSSEHLPIWGMTVDGLAYLPKRLEPITLEKDGFCWPTLTASDYRRRGPNSKQQGLPNAVGRGPLNPKWIEWFMGYPLGWTELKPWATQWFRPKRMKRLKD